MDFFLFPFMPKHPFGMLHIGLLTVTIKQFAVKVTICTETATEEAEEKGRERISIITATFIWSSRVHSTKHTNVFVSQHTV